LTHPPIKILASEGLRALLNIDTDENSKVQLYIDDEDIHEMWEGRITAMVSQMSGNSFWPNRVDEASDFGKSIYVSTTDFMRMFNSVKDNLPDEQL
jgi:hypothetical protein